MVTNEELQKIMKESNQKPFILDAREDLEFEIGHIPESTHIRFADLRVGRSKELPKNTPIYVLCWSGIRGKEVAEYLRTQGIFAKYLEKGVDSWVTFGGNWEGEIKFSHIFNKKNYQQVFSTTEVKKYIKEGVILVDSREPEKFQSKHIA